MRAAIVSILAALTPAESHAATVVVEPDQFPWQVITEAFPGVTLNAIGPGVFTPDHVADAQSVRWDAGYAPASTGDFVFFVGTDGGSTSESNRYLRATFDEPVGFVSIDVIGAGGEPSGGVLRAFNTAGEQVAAYFTAPAPRGAIETAIVTREPRDIAYVTAGGLSGQQIVLDNLQFATVPEPSALVLAAVGGLCLVGRNRRAKRGSVPFRALKP